MVYNCIKDAATTVFFSRLQVTHSFYKHLVKYEITKMRYILFQVQKYIQIEDATRSTANRPPKKGGDGEKLKPPPAFPKKNQNQASSTINKQPSRNPAKTQGDGANFTPFKISVDHVFNAIKRLGEVPEATLA